ncbi:MAG: hypothetical protein IJ661_04300 [Lachnospiraceae bacterium]|nr:hypothetical protein [Lachnospiraceae bacterium]
MFDKSYIGKMFDHLFNIIDLQSRSSSTEDFMRQREERAAGVAFEDGLISSFENWAMHTKGMPYEKDNMEEAMKKFYITEDEFHKLLSLTARSWI